MPETPFNSQDLRSRGLRSAAPTPDTAAPGRSLWNKGHGNNGPEDDKDEEEEENGSKEATPSKGTTDQPKEGNEFAKWFWEHRGDNNRAWKRRRREVTKEKRQRENRQRGRRVG